MYLLKSGPAQGRGSCSANGKLVHSRQSGKPREERAETGRYRLLFALYSEDRDRLPKRDPNYGGLSRLRDEVAERIDAGTTLSGRPPRPGRCNKA